MHAEGDSHRWGKTRRAGSANVAEENTRERLSATTRTKDRDAPFLASPPGAILPIAFADEDSLYLSGANVHLKHCLRGAQISERASTHSLIPSALLSRKGRSFVPSAVRVEYGGARQHRWRRSKRRRLYRFPKTGLCPQRGMSK
jgi:hypothetical protein